MLAQETAFKVKLWTVNEYHQLIEKGVFHPEERVELIAGQIIQMSAKGTAHTAALGRTDRLLQNQLRDRAWIRIQDPIQLNDNSEPEPDVSVVRFDPLDYSTHHPRAAEVYLIIEVADTSLTYDTQVKAQLYADSGIADYWVLDVSDRRLIVFREPNLQGYRSQVILEERQAIAPLAFPDLVISVIDILPRTN
jgi:Uma2 family endonuclease